MVDRSPLRSPNLMKRTSVFYIRRREVNRSVDEWNANRRTVSGFSPLVHSRYRSTAFHYPQPLFPRAMNYVGSSGDMFVEKLGKDQLQDDHRRPSSMFCLETVTIEEEKRRPSLNGMLSHVRNCSPVVRQLKIRSRPSSSFNLHERDASTGKQAESGFTFAFLRVHRRSTMVQSDRWTTRRTLSISISLWFSPRSNYSEWVTKQFSSFRHFDAFAEQLNAIRHHRVTIGPVSNRVRFRRGKKNKFSSNHLPIRSTDYERFIDDDGRFA